MTYEEFVKHIQTLPEYKALKKQVKPFKEIDITTLVPLKVSVQISWGLSEPTLGDFYVDSYVHDHETRVHSDPTVRAKILEQKKEVKAYLKGMKALVKREAKKAGVHKEGTLFTIDGIQSDLDDVMHEIA